LVQSQRKISGASHHGYVLFACQRPGAVLVIFIPAWEKTDVHASVLQVSKGIDWVKKRYTKKRLITTVIATAKNRILRERDLDIK
jgi:hypothetical protein